MRYWRRGLSEPRTETQKNGGLQCRWSLKIPERSATFLSENQTSSLLLEGDARAAGAA